MQRALIMIGGAGAAFTALCCVSPVLPIVLGAVGLSSLTAVLYRDAVLLPALAVFLVLLGGGLWLRRRR